MSRPHTLVPLAGAVTVLAAAAAIGASQPTLPQASLRTPHAGARKPSGVRQTSPTAPRQVIGVPVGPATCRHMYGKDPDSHGELGHCLAAARRRRYVRPLSRR